MITICGALRSDRIERIAGYAVAAVQEGKELHFLLPSVHYIERYKRHLMGRISGTRPGQLFWGTFVAWSQQILEQARIPFQLISRQEEILRILALREKTNTAPPDSFGAIHLLSQILDDLRNGGIDAYPESVSAAPDFAKEWLMLCQQLQNQYRSGAIGTATHLLTLALETLRGSNVADFSGLLVVDGFYEMIPIQQAILKELIRRFPKVLIGCIDEELPSRRDDFGLLEAADFGGSSTVISNPVREPDNPVQLLQDTLFQPAEKRAAMPDDLFRESWDISAAQRPIQIVRCPNRRLELETAARTVREWIRSGIGLEEIAILYRGSYRYETLLASVFQDFDIPVNPAERVLADLEPAQLLLRIFTLNNHRFARNDLEDLLRHASIRKHYDARLLLQFEYLSKEWGRPYSSASWLQLLDQQLSYLEKVRESDEPDPDIRPRELDERITTLREMQPLLAELFADITLPEQASCQQFARRCREILRLLFASVGDQSQREAIGSIERILRRIGGIIDSQKRVRRECYAMMLQQMIAAIRTASDSPAQKGICVTDIMSARGLRFRGVILLGLVEGEFPVYRAENPIFTNAMRSRWNAQLGRSAFSLTGTDLTEERFLLNYAIKTAEQKLLISFPQMNGSGQQLPVSPFIEEIWAAVQSFRPELQEQIAFRSVSLQRSLPDVESLDSQLDLKKIVLQLDPQDRSAEVLGSLIGIEDYRSLRERRRIEIERSEQLRGPWNGDLCATGPYPDLLAATFSASRLQDYTWCPFLYLCKRIWRVAVPAEARIDLGPLEEGRLIHQALEWFVRGFLEQDRESWKEYLANDSAAKLDQLLERIEGQLREKFGYLAQVVWQRELSDLYSGLEAFRDVELDMASRSAFVPYELEQYYGLRIDGVSVPVADTEKEVKFTAKIDRIDRDPQSKSVRVIEYKRSGKSARNPLKDLEEETYFQIPLYLMGYLQQDPGAIADGYVSHAFQDGRRTRGRSVLEKTRSMPSIDQQELQSLLENTMDVIRRKLAALAAGDFFLNPVKKDRCQPGKCDFFDLCRIDPRRFESEDDSGFTD